MSWFNRIFLYFQLQDEDFEDITESVCSEQYIKLSHPINIDRNSDTIKQQMKHLDRLVEELENSMSQSSKDLLQDIQSEFKRDNLI